MGSVYWSIKPNQSEIPKLHEKIIFLRQAFSNYHKETDLDEKDLDLLIVGSYKNSIVLSDSMKSNSIDSTTFCGGGEIHFTQDNDVSSIEALVFLFTLKNRSGFHRENGDDLIVLADEDGQLIEFDTWSDLLELLKSHHDSSWESVEVNAIAAALGLIPPPPGALRIKPGRGAIVNH